MKKYIKTVSEYIGTVIFTIFFILMATSLFNWMLELSSYNALSEFKAIDMNQMLIGLWFSLTFHLIIFSIFFIWYSIYKIKGQNWKIATTIFSIFNKLFIPSIFSFWMLLSLRIELFNLIATVLATAALLADFRKKSKPLELLPLSTHHPKKDSQSQ